MMAYFWWGLATFVVAALILLVAYATKAGRNAQAVNQSAKNTAQAKALTTTTAAMAQAQATGPQNTAQLLSRLDAKDA
ncbi:MAG: hypothetical protein ABF544_08285 [Acetobacter orientalis]|uniref:hypothetical protein n=1 Tax=Acetobacter orientalis TaxID=146474 RepID=UPI0039E9E3D3